VSGYFTRRVKVCLITEDYYALDFIEKIIRRIKSEGIIKQDVVLYKSESSKGKTDLLPALKGEAFCCKDSDQNFTHPFV